MYNAYYNNPYSGFGVGTNNYIPQPQNSLQGQINGNILKVSGINGVNALNLAPNIQVLALDETAPIVWHISTDSAGYKTPTAYDITPHKDVSEQKQNDFEKRLERLERIVNEQSDNKSNAKRTKSTNETAE